MAEKSVLKNGRRHPKYTEEIQLSPKNKKNQSRQKPEIYMFHTTVMLKKYVLSR